MAEKTMHEFSVPSASNVATGPATNVGDMNFEIKSMFGSQGLKLA
jgi:hypothetical protein